MARSTHGQIKQARSEGRSHKVAIRDQCRELRVKLGAKAKQLRENLSQAIKHERIALRGTCSTRLQNARTETDKAVEAARRTMVELARLRAAARSPAQRHAAERARLTRATSIKESDDEVRRNLTPDLAIVWEVVKGRPGMRASKRRTRTEAFLEWVHDHAGDAQRILAEHAEQRWSGIEESEADYHARKRTEHAGGRRRRPKVADVDAVPF